MNETKPAPISYNFELFDTEADVILKALGTLPFNEVNPIISKMFAQAQEQAKARADAQVAEAAAAASLEKKPEFLKESE
jgi:phosphoribosylformylglycinamidine (FGAM) synthase PurS component